MKFSFGKIIVAVVLGIVALSVVANLGRIFETNEAGFYQIKQAFWSGDMSVRTAPGTYNQNFGKITTYEMVGDIFLSKVAEDSDDGANNANNIAERVFFPDGYADVDLVAMYEMPLEDDIKLELHRVYNNDKSIKYMVKQQISEAMKNTGNLMSAEEAYSFKKAEFIQLAREQALNGLYKSKVTVDTIMTASGQQQIVKHYSVALDDNGKPIIMKESLLAKYNIALPQYNIKDMDFDNKLISLIDSRKDAQVAAQAAITEKAKGDKLIATEKATQEVQKIKEVTIAQKEKEVAELQAEKAFNVAKYAAQEALENKKKIIAQGQAEAEANRLKVAAGLTPQEKAEWEYKTKVGVAAELAKVKVPNIVMNGGNGGSGSAMDAIGINMLMGITEKLSK